MPETQIRIVNPENGEWAVRPVLSAPATSLHSDQKAAIDAATTELSLLPSGGSIQLLDALGGQERQWRVEPTLVTDIKAQKSAVDAGLKHFNWVLAIFLAVSPSFVNALITPVVQPHLGSFVSVFAITFAWTGGVALASALIWSRTVTGFFQCTIVIVLCVLASSFVASELGMLSFDSSSILDGPLRGLQWGAVEGLWRLAVAAAVVYGIGGLVIGSLCGILLGRTLGRHILFSKGEPT